MKHRSDESIFNKMYLFSDATSKVGPSLSPLQKEKQCWHTKWDFFFWIYTHCSCRQLNTVWFCCKPGQAGQWRLNSSEVLDHLVIFLFIAFVHSVLLNVQLIEIVTFLTCGIEVSVLLTISVWGDAFYIHVSIMYRYIAQQFEVFVLPPTLLLVRSLICTKLTFLDMRTVFLNNLNAA